MPTRDRIRAIAPMLVILMSGTVCVARTVGQVGGRSGADVRKAAPGAGIEPQLLKTSSRYRVIKTVIVGDGPMGVIAGYGSVWVTNHGGDTVSRIDPTTNRVAATIRVGRGPGHVASGYGAVWVTDDKDESLWRIDPRTNAATRIAVGGRISCVPALGLGTVWVTVWDPPAVVGIDPSTQRVVRSFGVDPQPMGVQFADGSLWVASSDRGGHLLRIDPRTGRTIARIFAFSDWSWLQSFAVGDRSVWVANPFFRTISRVDVRVNQLVAVIRVGDVNVATFVDGALWVADVRGTLFRIDPKAYRVTDTIHLGTSLGGVAAGFGSIWVPSYSDDAVSRIVASS